jgi:galactose oxidase
VLSAGQSSGKYENTGEIFSPPYLFKGARPVISSAPGTLGYGQAFTVTTPQAASISRVALVKAGAVTHSSNFDQRYVDCTFTTSGGALGVTSPRDANHAPPGWYMLFLVNSTGVPSAASWVQVS